MRKINSEISFKEENTKITIGTVDKKNPKTLFIIIGCNITPNETNENIKESMKYILKSIQRGIQCILDNSNICEHGKYIIDTDVAIDRLAVNKKSFFEIQIFLKVTDDVLEENCYNFEKTANTVFNEFHNPLINMLNTNIESNDFVYFKTNNTTIYHEKVNECKNFS